MYDTMTQDTHDRPDCDTSVSTDAAVLLNGAAFRLGYRWDVFTAVWWDRCGTAAGPTGLPPVRSCPIILRRSWANPLQSIMDQLSRPTF